MITHELSQIEPQDFVYVLKGGKVVEQGFRGDLEEVMDQEHEEGGRGEFRRMMASREVHVPAIEEVQPEEEEDDETASAPILPSLEHSSLLPLLSTHVR